MSLQLENGTTENLELKTEKRLVSKPAGFFLHADVWGDYLRVVLEKRM